VSNAVIVETTTVLTVVVALLTVVLHAHQTLQYSDDVLGVAVAEDLVPLIVFPHIEPQDVLGREVSATTLIQEVVTVLSTTFPMLPVLFVAAIKLTPRMLKARRARTGTLTMPSPTHKASLMSETLDYTVASYRLRLFVKEQTDEIGDTADADEIIDPGKRAMHLERCHDAMQHV
jgi:hypothetical protein